MILDNVLGLCSPVQTIEPRKGGIMPNVISNRIHVSTQNGAESICSYMAMRDSFRDAATPQPNGDGGVKVIENVTILSFDDDPVLTFIVNGTSYTILPDYG